ncbi:MAG TPA: DUF3089 domain-containing protein [Chitinophagaceae bacterium]|nr:DUF3089 domain-containing protein [Chitinophagaceae bacterium]
MKNNLLLFCIILLVFTSCADKYKIYQRLYTFKTPDDIPHYNSLNYWAAHPWKWDPSDSIPAPLKNEILDSLADVFFIHPTTFTDKKDEHIANAQIDDAYINAKTDYSSILFQASVFNVSCRVFAPRYRQAHIQNFFSKDSVKSKAAFAIAYADIKSAFEYYLLHYNHDRPIIIAGHSQGALMAEKLLHDYFENKPLEKQLVAAYIIGWPVPKTYFKNLPMCSDSSQTGCICSWRTLRKNYVPSYLKNENGNAWVTNPLSWTMNEDFVSRKMNKGSVLTKFNKVYKRTADAQIQNGLLYTRRPKFPWSFLFFTKNYHVGDINLYYINMRENVKTRIVSFIDHE